MTTRAAGYYWIRNNTDEGNEDDAGPYIASWEGCWRMIGVDGPLLDIADADVLAGPLQPPNRVPADADDVIVVKPAPDQVATPGRAVIDILEGPTTSSWRKLREALRSRARALLEGTTPGPWENIGHDSIENADGCTVADCYLASDTRFVLGAHALLTELAKEDGDG